MASVIRGSDNFDSSSGNIVKSWVNFNGTGTVSIRASFNVSSVTDNGVGDYTVNFINPIADANYSFLLSVQAGAANRGDIIAQQPTTTPTTNALRVFTHTTGTGNFDPAYVSVAVLR